MKFLVNVSTYLAYKTALFFFRKLPGNITLKLIIQIYLIAGTLFKIRKNTLKTQISEVFPNLSSHDLKLIIKKNYINMAITSAEMFLSNSATIDTPVRTNGWENITQALEKGNGVIIVSAHFGNWELAGKYMSLNGLSVGVIYKNVKNPYIDEEIAKIRKSYGIKLITKRKSVKESFRTLKENNVLCILADQNAGKGGIRMDFLGKPASVFTGPARIAIKTGAPIIFALALRNINYNDLNYRNIYYSLYYDTPLIPENFLDHERPEIEITKQLNKKLETWIEQYPEQWFWIHRRWRGAEKAKNIG